MINFASLGSQFFQETSDEMLVQPEPQHFWARALYAAEAGFQLNKMGIDWKTDVADWGGMGGKYPDEVKGLILAAASPVGEAIMFSQDLTKMVGDTIDINRPVHSVGGTTMEARTMMPNKPISKSTSKRKEEQTSISLVETGGPIADGESSVTPLGLTRFASMRSNKDLRKVVAYHLGFDRLVWLDNVIAALFDRATTNVLYPAGFSADDDITTSQDAPGDYELLTRVQHSLVSTHIPPFANGRYKVCLASAVVASLKMDPTYQRLAKDHRDANPLFPGTDHSFVSSVDKLDLYSVETIKTSVNSSGVKLYRNVAFGRGGVAVARGADPKVCADDDTDFGRNPKVMWQGIEGNEVTDETFLVNFRTTGIAA